MWVHSLGQEDLLEEGMATHSSILAWRIPWTEEPGWLQSLAKSFDLASPHTCEYYKKAAVAKARSQKGDFKGRCANLKRIFS